MNLLAGGGALPMPQMPQLPPNATPQQRQAVLVQMQMAQQQQAMLMRQQAAILQQRQHLQQAAAANMQAQAKVREQMEAVQRRRSSEGPHMAPLSESATSSGSAGATTGAANPPSAQSSAAANMAAGQGGSLAEITPEMAAQFGIDPAMLARLPRPLRRSPMPAQSAMVPAKILGNQLHWDPGRPRRVHMRRMLPRSSWRRSSRQQQHKLIAERPTKMKKKASSLWRSIPDLWRTTSRGRWDTS